MESNNCEVPNPGSGSQAIDSRMSPQAINPESNPQVIDLSSSPPAGLIIKSDDIECKDDEDLPSTSLNPVSYVLYIHLKIACVYYCPPVPKELPGDLHKSIS